MSAFVLYALLLQQLPQDESLLNRPAQEAMEASQDHIGTLDVDVVNDRNEGVPHVNVTLSSRRSGRREVKPTDGTGHVQFSNLSPDDGAVTVEAAVPNMGDDSFTVRWRLLPAKLVLEDSPREVSATSYREYTVCKPCLPCDCFESECCYGSHCCECGCMPCSCFPAAGHFAPSTPTYYYGAPQFDSCPNCTHGW